MDDSDLAGSVLAALPVSGVSVATMGGLLRAETVSARPVIAIGSESSDNSRRTATSRSLPSTDGSTNATRSLYTRAVATRVHSVSALSARAESAQSAIGKRKRCAMSASNACSGVYAASAIRSA